MSQLSYRVPLPLRRRCLHGLQAVLGQTPVPRWYVQARALDGAVILMYHSVADDSAGRWLDPGKRFSPAVFTSHAAYLARHRRVISLQQLLSEIGGGAPIPAGTVVITFDDGYLDNLQHAFPILQQFGLPATVFLATRYIDEAECQWIDHLYTAFQTRRTDELALRIGNESLAYSLKTSKGSFAAYRDLGARLLSASYDQRKVLLAALTDALAAQRPPVKLTMDWDDVREAAQRYPDIEFGSHTETHLDMSAAATDITVAELDNSRRAIEAAINKPARYFAYPYSRMADDSLALVRRAGYEAAVAGGDGTRVNSRSSCLALPREDAPEGIGRLAFVTSGAYPDLSRALVGRA
jgi:peptidoglycan/xylan/chitin deacetylase (PgdA/CDA1 family)